MFGARALSTGNRANHRAAEKGSEWDLSFRAATI